MAHVFCGSVINNYLLHLKKNQEGGIQMTNMGLLTAYTEDEKSLLVKG